MGAVFLAGYIIFIGLATFLMKISLKNLNAYQINLLMAVGMLVITVPALWLYQKSLAIPTKDLPLGGLIGLLMAAGSILFVLALSKLPVGLTAAIATSYVVLVVVLSWVFLREPIDLLKALGIALTVGGVAILSFKG